MRPLSGTGSTSAEDAGRSLRGSRVLVTGATGFIGAHLTRRLTALGCEVVILVRPSSDLWRIEDVLGHVRVIEIDLQTDRPLDRQREFSGVGVIFHLAAAGVNPSYHDTTSIVHTNTLGTLRMLQLALALEAARFVYCGSCFEYGSGTLLSEDVIPAPVSEYGASKSAGWLLTNTFYHRYSLPVVSLRPFNVYGPLEAASKLIPYATIAAVEQAPMVLTGGEQTRDFVFVDDVVQAFVAAAAAPAVVGGTFNVCTGRATPVREVVATILELTGSTITPQLGGLPYRDTDVRALSGNPNRAKQILGWTATTSLREGLQRTIQWFQEHRSRYPVYAR